MRTILIPTDFSKDTLQAIRAAVQLLNGERCYVTLLRLIPLPDSITELLFLQRSQRYAQRVPLWFQEQLKKLRAETQGQLLKVDVSHQYGVSRPLAKRLLEHITPDLVVIPARRSKYFPEEYHHFMHELQQSSTPILYLPDNEIAADITLATLLGEQNSMELIQQSQFQVNQLFNRLHSNPIFISVSETEPTPLSWENAREWPPHHEPAPEDAAAPQEPAEPSTRGAIRQGLRALLRELHMLRKPSLLVQIRTAQNFWQSMFSKREDVSIIPQRIQIPVLSLMHP
ncbi:Universal stress protein family protein [Catalinimonas alkaloidigena]|uniref:Universal stress protein family protein n=1 Tax=Catalinimonas alkaloidigena TaxID=1075417 RepID=A0A1G9AIT9_9BACT|nr:universal stress protein [Catalinimonas alkaloidigena]SDK27191.1 Universal stress protein family protein [Catalinimonas alkaloidigena]